MVWFVQTIEEGFIFSFNNLGTFLANQPRKNSMELMPTNISCWRLHRVEELKGCSFEFEEFKFVRVRGDLVGVDLGFVIFGSKGWHNWGKQSSYYITCLATFYSNLSLTFIKWDKISFSNISALLFAHIRPSKPTQDKTS